MNLSVPLASAILAILVLTSGCIDTSSLMGFNQEETNPENCEKLEGAARDTCFGVVAINLQDYLVCNQISAQNHKDVCLSGVANLTRDKALCEKITDSSIKDLCNQNFQ